MEKVRKLLEPFFNWEPVLKPTLPDFKKQVKKAIFWQEIPGVVAVSKNLILFWSGRRISLWQELESELGRELQGCLTKTQLEELALWLQENLPFGPKQKGATIEDKLWENLKCLWYGLESLEHQFTLRSEMQNNLWYTLFLAAGFCLARDTKKNFQPLLDLWQRGNFPAWFDRKNKIIVLCQKTF